MPIIRLPRAQAVADAAKPVLDRNQRPTVDNRGLSSAVGELADSQKQPEAPMSLANTGLEYIGAAVAKAGGVLAALAVEKQEALTRKQVGDSDAAVAALKTNHESWKESTQADPTTWEERRAQSFADLRARTLSSEGLTRQAKELIATRFAREDGLWKAEDELRATKRTFADVRDMTVANIERLADEQNAVRWAAEIEAGKKYLHAHEVENFRQQFSRIGEQKQKQSVAESERQEFDLNAADAISDPLAWLKNNAAPWKGRETQWARIKNIADAREAENTASAVQSLAGKMRDGTITVEGEIDAWEDPSLTPELREHAKEILANRMAKGVQKANMEEAADKRENGIKNAVEMRHKVMDYDPSKDPTRKGYFSLLDEIGKRVTQSAEGEITGALYRKYGVEPPKKMQPAAGSAAIFKDAIDAAFDPKKGLIPWMIETPELNATGRPIKDENGNVKKKDVEDFGKRAKAKDSEFLIRQKYEEWSELNPEATKDPAKIRAKIIELIPDARESGFFDGAQKKLPLLPDAGIKLSNYGYKSDTTPDTNSANGIGHANNRLVDGVSAAITKSLAVRLNLRTGDWVEIQTTKGPMKVRYDDTVPSTDTRTGGLPETIDIYRKNGANDWGGKVTSIRKIETLEEMKERLSRL